MTDAVRIFEGLKEAYLRYFDSPFDLRFDELVERNGAAPRSRWRPVPRSADRAAAAIRRKRPRTSSRRSAAPLPVPQAGLRKLHRRSVPARTNGLFPPRAGQPIELYTHQVDMLRASAARA